MLSWQDILIRLLLAVLLGSLVGLERQWNQKLAGLKTNALVTLGSAGFIIFSTYHTNGDGTMRIAAQIVSGIGFLGAGVILHEGSNIFGLNTAATLWCSAMLGMFIGDGLLLEGTIATVFVVLTNLSLKTAVNYINYAKIKSGKLEKYYKLEVVCIAAEEAHVRSLLLYGLSTDTIAIQKINSEDIGAGRVQVAVDVFSRNKTDAYLEKIVGKLSQESFVSKASWHIDQPHNET